MDLTRPESVMVGYALRGASPTFGRRRPLIQRAGINGRTANETFVDNPVTCARMGIQIDESGRLRSSA
jgi:hypothetical protein